MEHIKDGFLILFLLAIFSFMLVHNETTSISAPLSHSIS